MSDEIQIEGKSYISSKRASQLTGYAQDYIGQLARKTLIDARRIGGLWYVSMESLEGYKKKAEEYKPEPPIARIEAQEPGTLVFFDGKEYLSAGRAAELTGYAQDYVGQLGRSGKILSQQVGNRWYVEKGSIMAHKAEKDRLLAAVQRESVGLEIPKVSPKKPLQYAVNVGYSGHEQLLNYYHEDKDLIPLTGDHQTANTAGGGTSGPTERTHNDFEVVSPVYSIPIRRATSKLPRNLSFSGTAYETRLPMPRKSFLPMILGAVATIVIVLSAGYISILKQNSAYALGKTHLSGITALPASVGTAVGRIGDILEPLLTKELTYTRLQSQQ